MFRIGDFSKLGQVTVRTPMYEFEKPFVADHRKFAKTFGDHATPHREAVRATVAWYKQRLLLKN